MLQPISINAARALGKKSGARQLVILSHDGKSYSVTTWGKTKEECRALARWAESRKAVKVIEQICDETLRGGTVYTTPDPDCPGELGVDPLRPDQKAEERG